MSELLSVLLGWRLQLRKERYQKKQAAKVQDEAVRTREVQQAINAAMAVTAIFFISAILAARSLSS